MRVSETGIKSVDALYGVDFTGNVIPHSWYHAILTDTGKPDLTAIVILAEILYWHRPREECDESNKGNIKLCKRFKADQLQISYQQLHTKFGFSKDQSRRAMDHLEEMGLIRRHLRTITTSAGDKIGNVMYVELFTDRLLEITYPDGRADPNRIKPTRVSDISNEVIGKEPIGIRENPMTNTKNTTEISNTDYLSVYQREVDRVRKQVDYDCLIIDRKIDRGIIDDMVNIIAETNLSAKKEYVINGEPIPAEQVRDRLSKVNIDMIKAVIDNIKTSVQGVTNVRAYILTALYNEPSIYETDLEMKFRHDVYRREASSWGA